jgi:2-alkenal reductase
LIGVNTAIISGSGSSAGIGFAVPVDVVNKVVPQLIAKGKFPRPGIGIVVLDEEATASLGVVGVVIDRVMSDSEAQRAGLEWFQDPWAIKSCRWPGLSQSYR